MSRYEVIIRDTASGDESLVGLSDAAIELLAEAIREGRQELSPYAAGPVLAQVSTVIEGIERLL